MQHSPGTALITGASGGIGAVYADRLAARGHDLILVARNFDRLAAVARRLTEHHGSSVRLLPADLSAKAELARVEEVLRTDPAITMLVNNAGLGAVAPLLEADVAAMQTLVDVNVTATMRLVYAAAPGFAARGAGTLINIASIVAIGPEILNGVYGATKAFVLALGQSLHHELASKGVRIQTVLPGATATGFWEAAGNPVSNLPESIVMSATDLVDAALTGLDAGELVTVPALPDAGQYAVYDAARVAMLPNLSNNRPAARYSAVAAAA